MDKATGNNKIDAMVSDKAWFISILEWGGYAVIFLLFFIVGVGVWYRFREVIKKYAGFIGWVLLLVAWGVIVLFLWGIFNPEVLSDRFTEMVKIFLLSLGGLGAFYGLVVASRRQEKFEQQVETAQKQFSNEQFLRGIELLDNKSVSMRMAGVHILERFIEGDAHSKDTELILDVLKDFIEKRTNKDDDKRLFPDDSRSDAELALQVFIKFFPEDKVIHFKNLDWSGFSFQEINSKFIMQLENVDLSQVNFSEGKFKYWEFHSCDISRCYFTSSNLEYCIFNDCIFSQTFFQNSEISGLSISFLFNQETPIHEIQQIIHEIKTNTFTQAMYRNHEEPKLTTQHVEGGEHELHTDILDNLICYSVTESGERKIISRHRRR